MKHFVEAIFATAVFAGSALAQYNNQPMQPGAPPPQAVRPGSINYVEGQVVANGQTLGPQAVGHFFLEANEPLETNNGYAEVLLTPGAFLRIGPNSEIRMTAIGLADTRINLLRGNALVEADQVMPGGHLEVTLGSTSVDLAKKGLYGFAVNPQDVRVFDGKADVIGMTKSRSIGKHDEILLADNGQLKKTSFNENQAKHEPLYAWSEARDREEAAQNKLVAQNPGSYTIGAGGWYWNPYVNYWGFWPSAYLYSPFGFGFYGGFYPGFYGGYYGGFRGGFVGVHGNGVGGGGRR